MNKHKFVFNQSVLKLDAKQCTQETVIGSLCPVCRKEGISYRYSLVQDPENNTLNDNQDFFIPWIKSGMLLSYGDVKANPKNKNLVLELIDSIVDQNRYGIPYTPKLHVCIEEFVEDLQISAVNNEIYGRRGNKLIVTNCYEELIPITPPEKHVQDNEAKHKFVFNTKVATGVPVVIGGKQRGPLCIGHFEPNKTTDRVSYTYSLTPKHQDIIKFNETNHNNCFLLIDNCLYANKETEFFNRKMIESMKNNVFKVRVCIERYKDFVTKTLIGRSFEMFEITYPKDNIVPRRKKIIVTDSDDDKQYINIANTYKVKKRKVVISPAKEEAASLFEKNEKQENSSNFSFVFNEKLYELTPEDYDGKAIANHSLGYVISTDGKYYQYAIHDRRMNTKSTYPDNQNGTCFHVVNSTPKITKPLWCRGVIYPAGRLKQDEAARLLRQIVQEKRIKTLWIRATELIPTNPSDPRMNDFDAGPVTEFRIEIGSKVQMLDKDDMDKITDIVTKQIDEENKSRAEVEFIFVFDREAFQYKSHARIGWIQPYLPPPEGTFYSYRISTLDRMSSLFHILTNGPLIGEYTNMGSVVPTVDHTKLPPTFRKVGLDEDLEVSFISDMTQSSIVRTVIDQPPEVGKIDICVRITEWQEYLNPDGSPYLKNVRAFDKLIEVSTKRVGVDDDKNVPLPKKNYRIVQPRIPDEKPMAKVAEGTMNPPPIPTAPDPEKEKLFAEQLVEAEALMLELLDDVPCSYSGNTCTAHSLLKPCIHERARKFLNK